MVHKYAPDKPNGEPGTRSTRSCTGAVLQISSVTGSSAGHLSNPIQRALRDISIATNHRIFSKTNRYHDVGRPLTRR
ncbi:MAG: hypothetical protein HOB98_04495 [Gammaproteobacteria bacterium]|nr:hypothetical protein [Gammaproteobacteria bacterium]MBT3868251.1 hypothetical protein [Gammaproteobacteria bacterium]MBT4381727.1 hypothetical protein [Gammaproteobacteria bacterium]MBT4615690.1 hypothetical protein [Gammaproteobacteria bacterium]MBT5196000.1 hypothetical protein [Gammaproteobacteria bacterium]